MLCRGAWFGCLKPEACTLQKLSELSRPVLRTETFNLKRRHGCFLPAPWAPGLKAWLRAEVSRVWVFSRQYLCLQLLQPVDLAADYKCVVVLATLVCTRRINN